MPLGFLSSSSSPFDEIVERATADTLASENWDLILSINDKVNEGGAKGAKDCLLSLKKRLNHRDPHVVLLALSVIDSCVCNCGKSFRQEACSREFLGELKSKATGSNSAIAEKTRELMRKWVDEFKNESTISPLNSLYSDLKKNGYEFSCPSERKKSTQQIAALENALREEEELNRAIQISLKEQSTKPATIGSVSVASTSLYPSGVSNVQPTLHQSRKTSGPSGRVVKALYDFEAAEDNELTFKAGDLINILDDSDINWWKGSTTKSEGLFPASFVTADLSIDVEQMNAVEKKKSVQFDDNVKVETIDTKPAESELPKIDPEKLSKCLELLQNADPTGEREDPAELVGIEEQCLAMAPLIDTELVNYDNQLSQLSEANLKLMSAFDLYHKAMSDASGAMMSTFNPTPSPNHYVQPHSLPVDHSQSIGYQPPLSGPQPPMSNLTGFPTN